MVARRLAGGSWVAKGRPLFDPDFGVEPAPVDPDALFRPVSYSSVTEARTALGAPADANYVMWSFGNTDLETVFSSLSPNDILVLPERTEPYIIDSSKGFMAAGVASIDGVGANGLKDGSRVPIVSNPRLWFEMSRARRGIIGLGPGAVIQPSASAFTQGPQAILQDQPSGDQFQRIYFQSGATQNMVGAQNSLIGFEAANPFFANFTMRGRDFGGVSYSAIKKSGGTQQVNTFKRLHLDGAWRSHAGVPNGETGGITLNGGTYLIENCELSSPDGGSPIMWNNNTGGAVRNVRSSRPKVGMWTFWRCGGKNTFENVYLESRQTGINLEEMRQGFELEWTKGTFTLDYSGNKFHFGCNPAPPSSTGIAGGPPRITLKDLKCSSNAYTAGAVTINIYTTGGVAKRSYITADNVTDLTGKAMTISCVPSSMWVN